MWPDGQMSGSEMRRRGQGQDAGGEWRRDLARPGLFDSSLSGLLGQAALSPTSLLSDCTECTLRRRRTTGLQSPYRLRESKKSSLQLATTSVEDDDTPNLRSP